MTWTTDSYYTIGASHRVCQDYAVAKNEIVAVSDGCSSVEDTDIGARVLVRAATRNPFSYRALTKIITQSRYVVSDMGVPYSCLTATLLTAKAVSDWAHVIVAGDGVIIAKTRSGKVFAHVIDMDNTPAYPIYISEVDNGSLDPKQFHTVHRVYARDRDGLWGEPEDNPRRDPFEYCEFSFPAEGFEFVLLATDGLLSFSQDGKPIPLTEVVDQIVDFKGFAGVFVQRRMQAFERWCKKNNWVHSDDVAVAGLYAGKPQETDE